LILFLWQIPHFYAIAIYRLKDYQNAKIPVLPIRKGLLYTKFCMSVYILIFTAATLMPTILHYTGMAYFVVALILGALWFAISLLGYVTKDNNLWARQMFILSVIIITLISVMMLIKH